MAIIKHTEIKRLRREKKLTQEEVAKMVSLARSTYTRIELGDIEPSIKTLGRIAKALKVDISALLR